MCKKTILQLSIPQPCHENWDKMTPNEKGRHCASCNKTVIDFSLYTDKELVEFFANLNGSVCGMVSTYQLNRMIEVVNLPNRNFWHKLFWSTALASWFGLGTTAHAQSDKSLSNTTAKTLSDTSHTHKLVSDTLRGNVKIHIVDVEKRLSLAFANIIIEQNGIQVAESVTDIDGYTLIKALPTGKYSIKGVYEGYNETDTVFVKVSPEKTSYVEVLMIPSGESTKPVQPAKLDTTTVGLIVPSSDGVFTMDDDQPKSTEDIKVRHTELDIPEMKSSSYFFPSSEEGYIETPLLPPSIPHAANGRY